MFILLTKKTKVLQIVSGLDGGGVENILYNYYSIMDRNLIEMDIIVHSPYIGKMENKFKELGCEIYHVTPKKENILMNFFEINKIIKNGKYDVVHSRQDYRSFPSLFAAKIHKVNKRVVHCHIAYLPEKFKQTISRKLFTWLTKKTSTNYFACSVGAGKWFYGINDYHKGKVSVLNNAIKVDKFSFNENVRAAKRKEMGLEKRFVIGTIGRFTYQKNHQFLIRIFEKIHNKNPNAILLLTGKDELEHEIRQQVEELNLSNSVIFLGIRDDVDELMQVMDVFLLPTRYEGWGNVLIEAQISGLKCITSKDVVPKETKVTNCIEYLSLNESIDTWANSVLKYSNGYERSDKSGDIKNAGFDVLTQANRLERFYTSGIWE